MCGRRSLVFLIAVLFVGLSGCPARSKSPAPASGQQVSPQARVPPAKHPPTCTCGQCLILRWRISTVSVQKAEQDLNVAKWPAEYQDLWKRFISKLRPGYQLWFYSSPAELWSEMAGREGYAIFDGDRLVDKLTTKMN